MPDTEAVTVRDVELARGRIGGIVCQTPTVRSHAFGAWLKLENLQATGAYKVRGALNAALAQMERGDRRPLVAASAGNHAQGVAWAARATGLEACVVVPRGAPETKLQGARALGAEVVIAGACFDDSLARARTIARERNARLVHAFDDPEVIAGQGTIGFELLSRRPDAVIVPIGGGGLASGVGLVLRAHGIRVIGAQVAGIDTMRRVLAGEALPAGDAATVADGLRVRTPGALTARLCADLLDDIVVVTEAEVQSAIIELALRDKIVAEGAGAVSAAALAHVHARDPLAIISGGNIDLPVLGQLSAAVPR